MNNETNRFGPKVICKRPPTTCMCAQVIHLDIQTNALAIEFGQFSDNKPDWSDKKSIRLNPGEIAMMLGCILGYLPKCAAGYRESGLWIHFESVEKTLKVTMRKGKETVAYIKSTHSEQYQLYQMALVALSRQDQSTSDTLKELEFYFAHYTNAQPITPT